MDAQDWIKELWQIGNWIVGFEVVQTFTLLYAVTKPEIRKFTEDPRLRRYIVAWMLVISAVFCSAAFWTSAQAIGLHKTLAAFNGTAPLPNEVMLWVVVAGRIGCIVLLTALCVFALFAHSFLGGSHDAS